MTLVLNNDALGANITLVIFTEELGSLVRMFRAVLLRWQLLLLQLCLFLLGAHVAFTVQVVKYGEVLDQLLDIWAEVTSACRASQYVIGSQVHEAVLAEGVAAGEYAWDFIFVIVLIKADWTSYFHPVGVAWCCRYHLYQMII